MRHAQILHPDSEETLHKPSIRFPAKADMEHYICLDGGE